MCDVIFYPCVILNKKPVFRVFPGFFLTVFGFGFFEEPPQPKSNFLTTPTTFELQYDHKIILIYRLYYSISYQTLVQYPVL